MKIRSERNLCKVYMDRKFCKECNEELICTTVNTSNPPTYNHECPICKKVIAFNSSFPKLIYAEE